MLPFKGGNSLYILGNPMYWLALMYWAYINAAERALVLVVFSPDIQRIKCFRSMNSRMSRLDFNSFAITQEPVTQYYY